RECQWLTACSGAGAEHLQRLTDEPAKIALNYHGIDLERFPPPPRARPGTDGADPARPVQILAVGRAVDKKGFDDLLHALATLATPTALPTPHWRLTHVGDGALLPALKALAVALELAGRIAWLGALDQARLLPRYRQADLLVLPSRVSADGDRDGLPNVLLEAQSQALAVVTTPVGGIGELIDDQVNGLLVPEHDPTALAAALQRLLADPALRARFGEAGQARVRQRFSLSTNIGPLAAQFGLNGKRDVAPDLAAGAGT
ncbi:MAG: glycosyltransferase family 4 protein, partial [Salinisphaera sp.]|nr:glycosyltransferase family 4 protein [Salinisphaera sp.]